MEVREVTEIFHEAQAWGLEGESLRQYISDNVHPDAFISTNAQTESYLYHTVREALEQGSVNCNPPNMARNSRIVYRVIANILPDIQTDIVRRFNVIEREYKNQQTPSPACITSNGNNNGMNNDLFSQYQSQLMPPYHPSRFRVISPS